MNEKKKEELEERKKERKKERKEHFRSSSECEISMVWVYLFYFIFCLLAWSLNSLGKGVSPLASKPQSPLPTTPATGNNARRHSFPVFEPEMLKQPTIPAQTEDDDGEDFFVSLWGGWEETKKSKSFFCFSFLFSF